MNAHYYRGECEQRSGYEQEALLDFEHVINTPKSIFTEKSLYHAARISRKLEYWDKAVNYYSELEKKADLSSNVDLAQYWLMKLYFRTDDVDQGQAYALKVLSKENLSEDVRGESSILLGNSYLKTDHYNKAYKTFASIATSNDERGAEAKFNLAYIEYMRGNLDSSEKIIGQVLNQVPAYDYWIAKAFILWSDIYLAREDVYQAKVTLESVVENYEGEDLKTAAREKLSVISEQEKAKNAEMLREDKGLEINFDDMEDYDYLFEEEIEE